MTVGSPSDYEELTPEAAARVDAVCDDFERAWKATQSGGPAPCVAGYLDGWLGPERTVLAHELTALEGACRNRYRCATQPTGNQGASVVPATSADCSSSSSGGADAAWCAAENWPHLPGLELMEVLGRGGMGVVFKARQAALDRDVAVKLLLDSQLGGSGQRERFRLEARTVARLQHPQLVQVYDFGEVRGATGAESQPYLVLEYVSGGNLSMLLKHASQPPKVAARLVEILAEAIHYAHSQGVIHRDLKPANVLVKRNDDATSSKEAESAGAAFTLHPSASSFVPKITDFGMAKYSAGADLTHTGDVLGTPSYMAPEQTTGKLGSITAAVDVYGLGAILYEVLTGRPPFLAETAIATVMQVQQEEPVPLRRLQPTVPRDLETICLKCLRKEPRQRYTSAQALADEEWAKRRSRASSCRSGEHSRARHAP